LNKTKEKSATITTSLEESVTLGEDLDKVKLIDFTSRRFFFSSIGKK
jgi:hypothetical protein